MSHSNKSPSPHNKVDSIVITILQMRKLSTKKCKGLFQKSCSQEDKSRFSAGTYGAQPVCRSLCDTMAVKERARETVTIREKESDLQMDRQMERTNMDINSRVAELGALVKVYWSSCNSLFTAFLE